MLTPAVAAAMLVLTCAPPVSGQTSGGPTSTDQGLDDWPAGNPLILKAAMEKLRSGKAKYNRDNFANFTFFPHSKSLHQGRAEWQKHFKVIQSVRSISGKRLSLAGSGAQPGDVVLLYKQSGDKQPLVLVYAGEQNFPDEKGVTRSFFVYPYVKKTGMQFNTFPMRWTAKDMQKYGLIKPKPKKNANAKKTFVVSNTKQGARFTTDKRTNQPSIEWLRSPPVKSSVFARPTWFSGATYEVLRENFVVNYRVAGVRKLKQPKPNACWATVTTMMVSWKTKQNQSIQNTMNAIDPKYGQMYLADTGLSAADKNPFLNAANLQYRYPQNLSPKGWEQLLKSVGPVWVTSDMNLNGAGGIHARVLIGIEGDGTDTGTKMIFINPSQGKEDTDTLRLFVKRFEFETAVNKRSRTQIVHF